MSDNQLAPLRANRPMVKDEKILQVTGLKMYFPIAQGFLRGSKPLKAVDNVSFDLEASETLAVVGESGSGKSTLGRAVLQLLRPTGGKVVWIGEDLAKLGPNALRPYRADLQIVFQDPLASLNPRMTVGDIIAEPLQSLYPKMDRGEMRERVSQMMSKVGLLPQMINRYPHEFSGGQNQRIGIARAMILEPRLIVADEPVSALDVSIQAQIVNLLKRLQDEFQMSMLFISHDLSVVRYISHRVLVLYLGNIMEIADRDELFDNPRHPYTQALISAAPIPDPDKETAKPRIILEGDIPSPLSPPSGCVFRTRCPRAQAKCAKEVPGLDSRGSKTDRLVACHYPD